MNYCLYKLHFTTPLHCGRGDGAVALTNTAMTLRADTLFSALCNEAALQIGENAVDELAAQCAEGKLLFSDTFPFHQEVLYLPVPLLPLDENAEFDIKNRKAIKAVHWLPACDEYFHRFADYIKSGTMFDCESLTKSFAVFRTDVKACISREQQDTVPFEVGCCEFKAACGLYGIIGYESQEDADTVLKLLKSIGVSGIGGQVSRGFGKFTLQTLDAENPYASFVKESIGQQKNSYMLLTSSLPKPEEMASALEDAYYNLIRRGGLSWSPYADTLKKQTQYYLVSGSMLKHTFDGDVFIVGKNERHDIYRYARPIFLGVDL